MNSIAFSCSISPPVSQAVFSCCWRSRGNIWLCPPSIHSVGEDSTWANCTARAPPALKESSLCGCVCRVYERLKKKCVYSLHLNSATLIHLPPPVCYPSVNASSSSLSISGFTAPSLSITHNSSHLASSSHLHGHFAKCETNCESAVGKEVPSDHARSKSSLEHLNRGIASC